MASVPVHTARLRIEQVVAGGDGLAREASGRVVFVPGVLAGEEVSVRFVSAKRDFARAELLEVLEPSPSRVAAPCPARRRGCGGCDWQHLDPAVQLAVKTEVVREALRRTARLADAPLEVGGSVAPWAYRTSLRLAVDRDGRPSLRRPRSNEPIALDRCMVAHPRLDDLVHTARLRGVDEVSLRVSAATGERTAWWTGRAGAPSVRATLPDDVALGDEAVLHDDVAGQRFRVSAGSFFQSGPEAADLLVRTVSRLGGDELAAAGTVVDAYGGIGLFGATVTPADARVVVVEGSPHACRDAEVNLRSRDAAVVCTPVEQWAPHHADVVVADPSRHGLGVDAADRLVASGAPVMVLIGCDPVAFARDTGLLADRGYALARAVTLDLFPQTHHVEVVGRFELVAPRAGTTGDRPGTHTETA